jgi:predicted restriction endonuclease
MTTKKNKFGNSKGYGDRYPSMGTSAYAIWKALENIGFTENSNIKSAAIAVTSMKLTCDRGAVNPANVKIECSNFKKYLKNKVKELELLKRTPDNTLDIYNNYQDIQKAEDQDIFPDEIQSTGERLPPERKSYETNKIIRDQGLPKLVKEMYQYRCQICDIRLEYGDNWYAEAAHIRALGEPHNGADTLNNILCLCPNHHKLFDLGGFYIRDDLTIPALKMKLYKHQDHTLDLDAIRYHRAWCIES